MMQNVRVFVIVSLLVVVSLIGGSIFLRTAVQPKHEYRPGSEKPTLGLRAGYLPEQMVEDFLWEAQYLPPRSTSIACCTPDLQWDLSQRDLSEPERKIVDLQVAKVSLATWRTLLTDLLDDDPTYGALVHVLIHTDDENTHMLSFSMWDYGVLTPWGIVCYGDGWKPSQAEWLAE